MYDVKLTPRCRKELEKLPRNVQKRIVNRIHFFSSQENPLTYAKRLVNLPPTTYRFRIGDYRIAFYILKRTIYIERIAHRKEVYL